MKTQLLKNRDATEIQKAKEAAEKKRQELKLKFDSLIQKAESSEIKRGTLAWLRPRVWGIVYFLGKYKEVIKNRLAKK